MHDNNKIVLYAVSPYLWCGGGPFIANTIKYLLLDELYWENNNKI